MVKHLLGILSGEKKYHSVNCLGIHIYVLFIFYLCAVYCPKHISLQCIYLSRCEMSLRNMPAQLQIQMPHFASCTLITNHIWAL